MSKPRILISYKPNEGIRSVGSCRSIEEFENHEKILQLFNDSIEGLFKYLKEYKIIKDGELKISIIND